MQTQADGWILDVEMLLGVGGHHQRATSFTSWTEFGKRFMTLSLAPPPSSP